MIEHLFDLLAPHRCRSCGETGRILCESCKIDIENEPFSGCLVCLRPCGPRGVCEACAKKLGCKQAWCVGERKGALKTVLDAYKFDSSRAAATELAGLLDGALPVLPKDIAVAGVPTSSNTKRVRGFDHVGLVVRKLAKHRGLLIVEPLVRRSNQTLHFMGLKEREKLGPSLFALSGKPVPKTVLLVDDIVTTGTTLRAASALLKKAGVKNLYIAAIARQPNKNDC